MGCIEWPWVKLLQSGREDTKYCYSHESRFYVSLTKINISLKSWRKSEMFWVVFPLRLPLPCLLLQQLVTSLRSKCLLVKLVICQMCDIEGSLASQTPLPRPVQSVVLSSSVNQHRLTNIRLFSPITEWEESCGCYAFSRGKEDLQFPSRLSNVSVSIWRILISLNKGPIDHTIPSGKTPVHPKIPISINRNGVTRLLVAPANKYISRTGHTLLHRVKEHQRALHCLII